MRPASLAQACFASGLLLALHGQASGAESQCFGTVSRGHIEGGVALPESGPNFRSYSRLGSSLGRTHVHTRVREIVVAAYTALDAATPSVTYVYGETGWPSGGRLRPHRSHQNGLSVDFFVPVRNGKDQSVPLPTGALDKFGYAIEFDANAHYRNYTIDFPAIAEHLYQLDVAAKARGNGIALVIFDKPFLPKLFATPRGVYLRKNLKFMQAKPWVRHDEHYHVDFNVPCKTETQ